MSTVLLKGTSEGWLFLIPVSSVKHFICLWLYNSTTWHKTDHVGLTPIISVINQEWVSAVHIHFYKKNKCWPLLLKTFLYSVWVWLRINMISATNMVQQLKDLWYSSVTSWGSDEGQSSSLLLPSISTAGMLPSNNIATLPRAESNQVSTFP